VANALQIEKPALILIDEKSLKPDLHHPFDYIAFYSQSVLFRSEWQHYYKIDQIESFAIYLRKN
jgi:hypothetical protein